MYYIVASMPEADRQPGGIRVAVTALPDMMIWLRGMTGFAVTQPDMIKIVYEPTVGVGMTGAAGT